MSDRLDATARALAAPMSRRRAVRLLGASLVGAAIPAGISPRPARAQNYWPVTCGDRGEYRCSEGSKCCNGACCPEGNLCCNDSSGAPGWCCGPPEGTTSDGRPVRRFCGDNNPYACREEVGCPPNTTPCGTGSGAYLYADCCQSGTTCRDGRCVADCPSGRERCGTQCCGKGEECSGGRCRRRCPDGRMRCGERCCPKGQRCEDPRRGTCSRCGRGKQPCGKKCCSRKSYCCGDADGGICCPRKGGSCCSNEDVRGRKRFICCKKKTTCARPVAMSASGTAGGVDHEAPYACCPRERYVERPSACCPPGHVSLGGEFILPAGGGGGLCCRKDKLCGSGSDRTCCSTGTAMFPEFEQACCGGRCVSIKTDASNCGACGNACPPGQRCQMGSCVPA